MLKALEETSAARSGRRVGRRRQMRPALPRHVQKREKELPPTLGSAAKQARKRAGLTQEEVADGAGVATEVYGRMERGLMLPSVPTLLRLCLTLQSTPDVVMGFAPLPAPRHAHEASPLPPGLHDDEDTRRLLRLLARLNRKRIQLLVKVAQGLLAPR
ncbi:helix-turn-helix transcriptional regulator [Stigmatella sp. ncwal1]|uniref:Helix-turn-helix transcriptional regulator n=1 Tax=Stigmatella ashevillensis TaxID=2995309 RepID=A0ABT5DF19_9BACT|nr:helix-turn-helix transcriptional regulator [Stigmatella ashevillena]MDC0711718.1 helix-turn-helix transcriptional regulator [Stigmatella ashevillena]